MAEHRQISRADQRRPSHAQRVENPGNTRHLRFQPSRQCRIPLLPRGPYQQAGAGLHHRLQAPELAGAVRRIAERTTHLPRHIESCGRRTPICEIELEPLSGKVEDIFWLTRQLQGDIHHHPAIAARPSGHTLFLDTPLKPVKAWPAAINADIAPAEAFRCIALNSLEHFQRNDQGLLTSKDPEFVHQACVTLRRLRSVIKLFAPVPPPEFVAAYGQTWQTLGSALVKRATRVYFSKKHSRRS